MKKSTELNISQPRREGLNHPQKHNCRETDSLVSVGYLSSSQKVEKKLHGSHNTKHTPVFRCGNTPENNFHSEQWIRVQYRAPLNKYCSCLLYTGFPWKETICRTLTDPKTIQWAFVKKFMPETHSEFKSVELCQNYYMCLYVYIGISIHTHTYLYTALSYIPHSVVTQDITMGSCFSLALPSAISPHQLFCTPAANFKLGGEMGTRTGPVKALCSCSNKCGYHGITSSINAS